MLDPFLWTVFFVATGLLMVSVWLVGSWKAWGGVMLAAFGAAGLSVCGTQYCKNSAPVYVLHPELADRGLDSAEVPGAGFPVCHWAHDDFLYPGITELRSAILWGGA